jgi:hypothetical protein
MYQVDVLNGNLKTIEAVCLGHLHLFHEATHQVLCHDAVTSGKECQNVLDEVLFISCERLPVLHVITEIDLLGGPEGGLGLLVHLPDALVADGEQYKALRVLAEQGFNGSGVGK